MTVLPQRGHFGFARAPGNSSEDRYVRLWSACVHALQDSTSFGDFSNFKYQETLVLQVRKLAATLLNPNN
jgi:hypothetical protein